MRYLVEFAINCGWKDEEPFIAMSCLHAIVCTISSGCVIHFLVDNIDVKKLYDHTDPFYETYTSQELRFIATLKTPNVHNIRFYKRGEIDANFLHLLTHKKNS